jgi:hypothetical protein
MDDEARRKLGETMGMQLMQRRNEARAEHLKRMGQPLCHRIYHPFLGASVFKSTCPECGWEAPKRN